MVYARHLKPIRIHPAYRERKAPQTITGRLLSTLALPFRFRALFERQSILKTDQMRGAWVPLVAKWLTGRKLLVRCGFEQYQLLVAQKAPVVKKWFYYLLSKVVYQNSDAIIVTSPAIVDFINTTFNIDWKKFSVCSNLIDTDVFNYSKLIPGNEGLLFVGRLNLEKNLFNLITAVKKVNVPLTIVGEGKLLADLQVFAGQIGAEVKFMGLVPNPQLPDLIAKHNLFILPSFHEGNPKALLEAMSCGRAVIGTNVPGIRNIVKHQKNGLLCGTEADQIADAIDILRNDSRLQQTLSKNAREYVEKNCSVDKIVAQEIAVIRGLLNE